MTCIKVKWNHSNANDPILLYSELDSKRLEIRKVEIFQDGHCDYASSDESSGSARLGKEPIPSLAEIASDSQFEPIEITIKEFEEIWTNRKS